MTDLIPQDPTSHLPARVRELIAVVEQDMLDSLAPNTRRAYASDWRDFVMWSEEQELGHLPAEPSTLALYAAHLADLGRKASTIGRRMAAIRQYHLWAGFEQSPTESEMLEKALKGLRKRIGTRQEGKAPTMAAMLRQLVEACPDDLKGLRDRAVLLIGYAGAFRRSELISLDVEDVAFIHEGLEIMLRRSKTDQEGEGIKKAIPYGSIPITCPVRTLRLWLDRSAITEGAIFRPLTPQGTPKPTRLRDEEVSRIVKRRCVAVGIDPDKYAGHSLRAGLATQAARNGVPEHVIARQTGHKSLEMLRKYIREGDLFRDNAAGNAGL